MHEQSAKERDRKNIEREEHSQLKGTSVRRRGKADGLDCVGGQRSGTKILCMHNLSRIYDWQYCPAGVTRRRRIFLCVWVCECVWAWHYGLDRRLCVQEIKLPNAHYIARVKDG